MSPKSTGGTALRQRAEQLAATLPPLLVAAERVAATVAQGVHGRRRVGVGETFWQFRQYQPGDSASEIDWRQSAKTQRIFVRENEWEAAESIWLWCDLSPSMGYRSRASDTEKLERAALLTLALGALLVRGGERIALLGEDALPSTGRAALNRVTAALVAGDGSVRRGAESLPRRQRLPRYAQLVMIGDFLSPLAEIEAAVRSFAAAGVKGHLLQVLDPAEEDLPFTGRTEFRGLEAEGSVVFGRVERLREAYDRRMAARREDLTQIARAVGWSFAHHRTDRPPELALLALYSSLAGTLV